MESSSKIFVDNMKRKMKKQFKQIEKKMEDYEKYKTNYEYLKYSPYVQELLTEIADLKRVNKILINELTIKNKSDKEINKMRKHKPVIVKLEPIPGNGKVIDLTQEHDDDAHIVYDLEELDNICNLCGCEMNINKNGIRHTEDYCYSGETAIDEDDEEQDAVDEEVDEDDEEDAVEEELEEEVYEVKIKNKTYYTTNEKNGTIYCVDKDGEIGDEVGQYVNGKPNFT